jgi:hypothetical protein
MVRELLAAGEGKTLAIGGYVGPTSQGRVRLYADLRLRTYIELDHSDIVRVIDSTEAPQGPSTMLFKRDAEVTYDRTATMRADQALTAALTATPVSKPKSGCGCAGAPAPTNIAREREGDGPEVNVCVWGCDERLSYCGGNNSPIGQLWCYFHYGFCRLDCIEPPIITI